MSVTKETVESKIKKIVENCIHKDVLKDKEAYEQYNGVVGTTYDANSYEDDITNAPDYLMDHIPGGIMVSEGEEHDYNNDYLTTEALESGTISFNILRNMGTEYITSISYSTDNGKTWNTIENTNNKEENLVIEVEVNEDDKILWKGVAQQLGTWDGQNDQGSFFSSTAMFNVYGNVMSMLYEDNFVGENTLEYDGQICHLFSDANLYNDPSNSLSTLAVDASNLILPSMEIPDYGYTSLFYACSTLTSAPQLNAIVIGEGAYRCLFSDCTNLMVAPNIGALEVAVKSCKNMFRGCTNLEVAPTKLPAITLASNCYNQMFYGCTSLVTVPELLATTLAEGCYISMFRDCTALVTAPELLATTLAEACYGFMFYNCSSLVTPPELPATTLTRSCYEGMFSGCTSLVNAPELPATTLADYCYHYMFRDCTALFTASELPATTLAEGCYGNMFQDCKSLVTAPELPATTLANYCYNGMFLNCTALNYIEMLATNILPSRYLDSWVNGVSRTGIFVKTQGVTIPSGISGIPTGWTVQEK